MEPSELVRLRLHAQRLWGPPLGSAEHVLGAFSAMQAQEFVPAKWSLAQRCAGLTEPTFDQLFAEGNVLRTHVLRPTWHFARREDIRWLLAATAGRVHQLNAYYYRQVGLDDETAERSADVLRAALAGGRQLVRRELATAYTEAGLLGADLSLAYLLIRAELDEVIVSGALRGRAQTYALFDDRVPSPATMGHETAVRELATRYLRTRGPATAKDFAAWSSLTVTRCRRAFGELAPEVERVDCDGLELYWFPKEVPEAGSSPVVDLIQGYDEYVMSYKESRRVIFPPSAPQAWEAAQLHTLLIDGQIVGHWRHRVDGRGVALEASFHRELSSAERASVGDAVDRFGEFLQRRATWTVVQNRAG